MSSLVEHLRIESKNSFSQGCDAAVGWFGMRCCSKESVGQLCEEDLLCLYGSLLTCTCISSNRTQNETVNPLDNDVRFLRIETPSESESKVALRIIDHKGIPRPDGVAESRLIVLLRPGHGYAWIVQLTELLGSSHPKRTQALPTQQSSQEQLRGKRAPQINNGQQTTSR